MKKIVLTLTLLMTFVMGAVADDVKTPYAVWVNNSYLFFTMRTGAIAVGDTFVAEDGNEYTVSGVWSGNQVVNSPQYSTPAWNSSTTRNNIRGVVFESSFQDARPKSLYDWFYNCKYLSSVSGIENLNTSECLSMGNMFYYCQYLSSIDLSQLDTHNVEEMNSMFFNCYRLTTVGDLSGWNTDNLTQVSYMFYACRALGSVDLSGWNTSNVESFEGMFFDCRVLTCVGDLSGWQLGKATSTTNMFKQCYKLETLDVSTWDVSNVRPISTKSWFNYFSSLTNVEGIANLNMNEVVTTESMFESCSVLQEIPGIEHLDMSHVVDGSYMFGWCYQLNNLDVSPWDVSQLENAENMFISCEELENIDVSGWNTSRLKNAGTMFAWCSKLNSLDVSAWDVSSLQNAYAMFCGLSWENVDLSGWDTSSLENCNGMFAYSPNLTTVNISGWNTDGITSISSLFNECSSLTTITGIEDFNTSNVEFMSSAFSGCSALESLDLSQWNTSQVEFMADMFSGCTHLEAIYVGEGWTTDNVVVGTYYYQTNDMFEGCAAIIGEDGTTYDAADYTIARAHYNEGGYLRRHHADYTITIPSSGISTFSAAENVTLAEGLTAYTCTDYDEAKGVVTAQHMEGDIIPAHTGVLTKVSFYETKNFNTAPLTINIYSGGDTALGTLLYTETVQPLAGNTFHEVTFASPVVIERGENLWITLTSTSRYVMPACVSDEPNNQWLISNGAWTLLSTSSPTLSQYGWMIRGTIMDIDLDNMVWTSESTEETMLDLSNLEQETGYMVRVRGNCPADGDPTNWVYTTFTTPHPCAVPIDVAVDDVTSATALLSWTGYRQPITS